MLSCGSGDDAAKIYSDGVRAFHEKKFDESEKLFRTVIDKNDEFLNAYLMLAKIYYYNRDYSNSVNFIDEIIKRDPDHVGALYWKARILVMADRDRNDEPVKLLKKVLETDSSHIPARILLSLLYDKNGNYREAIHEYVTVLGEEEDLISARGNLAILYMRLGMKERAKSEIDKAVKIAEITGCGAKNINFIKRELDKWEEK